MNFVIDTNVVSELRKARRGQAHPNVAAWSDTVVVAQLFLSVITIFELEIGVALAERRDEIQGRYLRRWLDVAIVPAYRTRIIGIDVDVAEQSAHLHAPNPRSDRDALIAATALVHNMTVVTRNVADFAPTGVRVLNPWDFTS